MAMSWLSLLLYFSLGSSLALPMGLAVAGLGSVYRLGHLILRGQRRHWRQAETGEEQCGSETRCRDARPSAKRDYALTHLHERAKWGKMRAHG